MRLIAVPLARASRATATTAGSSSRLPTPICTYIVQLPPPPTSTTSSTTPGSPTTPAKLPLSTRLLNKASDFWLSLGKDGTEPGKKLAVFDWKRRTYAAGEKLMDRIEYQEWALKGVDPALGPGLRAKEGEAESKDAASSSTSATTTTAPRPSTLPLLYPSSLIHPPSNLLHSLTHLTLHRTPHHRTRLLYCVLGMPLTIPFALVPIVPNLPFFYLVWRAWSHWKAWKASEYLGRLLDGGRVELRECEEVDGAFRVAEDATSTATPTATSTKEGQGSSTATPAATATAADSTVEILLTPLRIDELACRLKLDEQPVLELRRALQQTRMAEEKGELKRVIEEEERAAMGAGADAGQEGKKDR